MRKKNRSKQSLRKPVSLSNDLSNTTKRKSTDMASKRRKETLRLSEKRFRALVENINDVFFSLDARGNFTYISPVIERFAHYKEEEIIGQPFALFVHTDDLPGLEASFKRTLSGKLETFEFRVFDKNGTVLHVRTSSRPLWEADQLVGLTGIMVDITEHKRIEQERQSALEELKELEIIVNRSPVIVFLWRATEGWPVEFVSDNIDQFGYSVTDFTSGRIPYAQIIHPNDLERVRAEVIQYSRGGRDEFIQEYRILTRSGDVRWIDDRTLVRRDSTGSITHYQGIVIDITTRKQVEEELQQAHVELEQRVKERTVELASANTSLKTEITERIRAEVEIAHVNRALQILSSTNQALIHIADEATLLKEVCRIVVDIGGYRMAWVGYTVFDEEMTLRPVAHAGFESDYIETANVSFADNERGRGPGGIAIRTGQPSITRDIPSDPAFAPWREAAIQRGYKSVIALPLIYEGQVLGALGIYSVEADAFNAREVEILKELASDLAFGITTLRTRVKRIQFEESLKEQYSMLRSIIDSTNALIFSVDKEFRYTSFNKSHAAVMKAIYGADIELNHSLLDYMTVPEDREKARKNIIRALTGERHIEASYSGEEKLSRLYFEISHNPILAENGSVIGVVVFAQDITMRMQAEEAVRESEERYRALFQGAAEGILVANIKTKKFMYANPAQCRMLGYTREELEQMCLNDIHPKKDLEWVLEEFMAQARGEKKVALDIPCLCKDGATVYADVCTTPMVIDGTECNVGFFSDITEHKRAEAELRRLTHAIEQSPVSVLMTNTDGDIEYVNRKFTEITGYTKNELQGKNPRILKSGETSSEEYKQLWDTITAGKEWRGEFHNKKKNGELFWEAALISPVRDEKGTITHYVAIKEDITERKRREEELKQNEQRRRELERELIQAQKLESLGTLASGIAHDFNNILGIILGHSDLLEEIPSDPIKVTRSLDAIHKAALRGASLVMQLLTFARKSESVFVSVSINDIIIEVINLLRETFPKTICVSTELKTEIPSIVADMTQIHQVLLNLSVNARDAMPKGGNLTITTTTVNNEAVVSRFPKATGREYVLIGVTDTGMGMDDETKQRIFDPFFTTKGPGKGTGLGLALVYSIIENHHGMIAVESTLGLGTTFSLYIPVEEHTIESAQSSVDHLADIPGGTETILFIEDEEMLIAMIKPILIAKGYTVLTASDGEEGCEIFLRYQKQIAAVFSDLGLPKFGGDEVFKRIRAIDPQARFVLASGFIEATMKSELLEAGLREFVQKPYSASDVLRAIRTAIDQVE